MSEVNKYMALGEMVQRSRKGGGTFVSLADHDALVALLKTETLRADAAVGDANEAESAGKAVSLLLAERTAQRDEGLAREVELKKELAQFQNGYTEQWQSREALQQRLVEAKRLLLDVRGQLCGPDQRAIDAFLASSGCADGEQPS